MYEILLTLHLLAAVTWVGGSIAMTLLAARMSPDDRMAVAAHFDWYGAKVITGAAFVLIFAGFGLVAELDHVEVSDPWVIIGIVGWLASAAIGIAFFGPMGKKIQAVDREEAGRLWERMLTVSRIDTLIVVLVVVDMAVKPGA